MRRRFESQKPLLELTGKSELRLAVTTTNWMRIQGYTKWNLRGSDTILLHLWIINKLAHQHIIFSLSVIWSGERINLWSGIFFLTRITFNQTLSNSLSLSLSVLYSVWVSDGFSLLAPEILLSLSLEFFYKIKTSAKKSKCKNLQFHFRPSFFFPGRFYTGFPT